MAHAQIYALVVLLFLYSNIHVLAANNLGPSFVRVQPGDVLCWAFEIPNEEKAIIKPVMLLYNTYYLGASLSKMVTLRLGLPSLQPSGESFFPLSSSIERAVSGLMVMVRLPCHDRWLAMLGRCVITFGLLLEKVWRECCKTVLKPMAQSQEL